MRRRNIARILAFSLMLVYIISALIPAKVYAAKKKSSGKDSGPLTVAVVDLTYGAASRAVNWAERCGMKAVWIHSKKVNPAKYDGLIIPGGGDVDPRLYKAKRNPHTYGTNMKRSKLQIDVILKFAKAKKPVLGLCGGAQTINVAFGGTLKQHIGWHTGWHGIRIAKKSWLYGMFGSAEMTYHYHHQCVKKLGKGLKAVNWGTDNNEIEGIEHETLPVYGTQWHPESMDYEGRRVGWKFMSICRKYKKISEKSARKEKKK